MKTVGVNYSDQYSFIVIAPELDFERNQINFLGVPYLGQTSQTSHLVEFLVATYKKYGSLLPDNYVKKSRIDFSDVKLKLTKLFKLQSQFLTQVKEEL